MYQEVFYVVDLSDGWVEASAAQGSRETRDESSIDRGRGLLACLLESQSRPRDGTGGKR
jgi:hypothetical protein